jgi:hypothetical protein
MEGLRHLNRLAYDQGELRYAVRLLTSGGAMIVGRPAHPDEMRKRSTHAAREEMWSDLHRESHRSAQKRFAEIEPMLVEDILAAFETDDDPEILVLVDCRIGHPSLGVADLPVISVRIDSVTSWWVAGERTVEGKQSGGGLSWGVGIIGFPGQ